MLTKAEMESFRQQLLALKKRVGGDLSELEEEALHAVGGEESGGLSNVPVHPADLGTDNFEEALALDLLENEEKILDEVNDALARIEQGTFGRCENCGQEISRERLKALPYARYCIRCARKIQGQPTK
jgi:DnaK suppressor protein